MEGSPPAVPGALHLDAAEDGSRDKLYTSTPVPAQHQQGTYFPDFLFNLNITGRAIAFSSKLKQKGLDQAEHEQLSVFYCTT